MIDRMMTPSERLRPGMGVPRIEYDRDGEYVVRASGVRMDPQITPGERRFNRAMEQIGVALVWIVGIPATAVAFYWGLVEGSKIVYAFALTHPFWR